MRGLLSKSTTAENTSAILAAVIWTVPFTWPFRKKLPANSSLCPSRERGWEEGGGVRESILTSTSLLGSHAISNEWSMLCNSGIWLQRMVAGVHGVTGAHALKRVALDHSTANDPVLGPLRHMEENHARDKLNRQELVTRSFAPVCVMACNPRNTVTNTGVKSHCQLSFGTLKKIFEIFFWLNDIILA